MPRKQKSSVAKKVTRKKPVRKTEVGRKRSGKKKKRGTSAARTSRGDKEWHHRLDRAEQLQQVANEIECLQRELREFDRIRMERCARAATSLAGFLVRVFDLHLRFRECGHSDVESVSSQLCVTPEAVELLAESVGLSTSVLLQQNATLDELVLEHSTVWEHLKPEVEEAEDGPDADNGMLFDPFAIPAANGEAGDSTYHRQLAAASCEETLLRYSIRQHKERPRNRNREEEIDFNQIRRDAAVFRDPNASNVTASTIGPQIHRLINELKQNQYRFYPNPAGDQGKPHFDHRYSSLFILVLNQDTQFTWDALSAHLPYPVPPELIQANLIAHFTREDESMLYRNCFDVSSATISFRNNDNRNPAIVRSLVRSFLAHENLPCETVYSDSKTSSPPFRHLFQYYDEELDDIAIFRNDLGYGVFPQWAQTQTSFYASPIKFEYHGLTDSHTVDTPEGDARNRTTFLRQKYSDIPKTLFVCQSFNQQLIESAHQHNATLLTYHDLYRFLHVPNWLFRHLSDPTKIQSHRKEFAPPLDDWNQLLSAPGLASEDVLRIIRARQRPLPREKLDRHIEEKRHEIKRLKQDIAMFEQSRDKVDE